ncbi:hypothetical protein BJY04DRAFT_230145 [Aspergillus karnatakaensis]|uniref:uncharacterized protein n=1 Tax=Aspergillus karnatakaensis TaxID=1810916 RepID=UPI003CCCEE5F
MNGPNLPPSLDDFEVAIVCALPLETDAVLSCLNEVWFNARYNYRRARGDDSTYVFGQSGRHPVVVVTLPDMGKEAAIIAAQSLKWTFRNINLVLLVGVCGGVPLKSDGKEIVLGDVVISEVVVELDEANGRLYQDGIQPRRDTILDASRGASDEVRGLLRLLKTPTSLSQMYKGMMETLDKLTQDPNSNVACPHVSQDKLFPPYYIHKHRGGCLHCNDDSNPVFVCKEAQAATCERLGCDETLLVPRRRLTQIDSDSETPRHCIHFGSIGTAGFVMKSSMHRDQYAKSEKVIAFEMEGAGLWKRFNCLIIKGVCDYADSHKNKKWQEFSAVVAASAAMEVLVRYVPHDRPELEGLESRLTLSTQNTTSSAAVSLSSSILTVDGSFSKEVFHRTLTRFKKSFTPDQLEVFQKSDLGALKRELKRVQDEQERARELRNLRRLEQFIEKITQLGQVLESILDTTEPINLIWGPVKSLLQVAKGQTDLLDTLLSAYETLGLELPNFGEYSEAFKQNPGLQRVIAKLFADIMDFHENTLRLYSGRALKAVFKSLWKDFYPTFDSIVHRIRSHTTLIEDKAQMSYTHAGQYDLDMRGIREHLIQVDKLISERKEKNEKQREKKLKEVLEWIAGAESSTEHKNICHDRDRYPGSGAWVLENGKVQDWLSPNPDQSYSSILWINGQPGTGKTYLASVVIEECMKDSDWTTCYFYCNEKVEKRASAIAVLRGILLQLIRKHQELVPYCHARMKSSHSPFLSDISAAYTLIETFCERIPKVFMIIDGLDECEEGRKDLLETFKSLIRKTESYAPGKLRALFLSRPLNEIKNAVPDAAILALTPEHNKADIQKYCQARSVELEEKFNFTAQELVEPMNRICIRANGMFLFAKLVMNNLAKQSTRRSFHAEISLDRLPNELDEAYARIMERLKGSLSRKQLEYTRLLLGWLVCSKRPLKWTEIQLALSIDMNVWDGPHQIDKELKLQEDIQELCGSLVQVLRGNRVELVHSTARAFIEKSDINLAAAECDLTLRCLRYLTLDLFQQETPEAELHGSALQGDFAFQDYAVESWFLHFKSLVESKGAFLQGGGFALENSPADRIAAVSQEIGNFVNFYGDSFPDTVLEQSRKDCAFYQQYDFYDDLVTIWDHICAAQRGDLESRNNVSIPVLKETLKRNRTLLEKLSQDPKVDYSSLYDDYPFRCPKIMCFYFHEGFKTNDLRDNHVNYHDLPFHCLVESCQRSVSGFGFRSNNELTSHNKKFHPEEVDLSLVFANVTRREIARSRWECPTCHKFFVRRNILEDHTRSHKGEKPFCCSECGKGFARKNDMRRHEKIHERRRR